MPDQQLISPEIMAVLQTLTSVVMNMIPSIGPTLLHIFSWLGIIASILTALSAIVQIILSVPELVARISGAPAIADKIKYYSDRVIYVLKFFSMFNAKKPQ